VKSVEYVFFIVLMAALSFGSFNWGEALGENKILKGKFHYVDMPEALK